MTALLVAVLLGATPTPAAKPAAEAFVLADVLRLRAQPAEKAPVVARARIGTRVELREERGDWARVRLGTVEGWTFDGWALRSLLGPAPLGRDEALSRAERSQGAERIGWLERAAAIDPARRETWAALAEALEAAGRGDRARHARGMLAGTNPGFLATCNTLVAEWTPGTPERKLSGDFSRESPGAPLPPEGVRFRRELVRLADELPAAAWFRFGGGMVDGSPFPRPKLLEEPEPCDESWLHLALTLGDACGADEAWLATTTPLTAIAPEKGELDDRIRKAIAARDVARIERAEVRRVPGTPALLEVRFTGLSGKGGSIMDPRTGAERPIPKLLEGWALFGEGPEPLAFETMTADVPAAKLPDGVAPEGAAFGFARWSRLALRPGVRVAATAYSYGSGGSDGQSWTEAGYYLVTVDESGRVDVRKLTLEEVRPC